MRVNNKRKLHVSGSSLSDLVVLTIQYIRTNVRCLKVGDFLGLIRISAALTARCRLIASGKIPQPLNKYFCCGKFAGEEGHGGAE